MRVRIALIGCGKVTERIALPQVTACPQALVTALVDRRRAAARRLARRFGLGRCPIWTDWRRMLRQAEVDAVAVNLPNALHAEVAIAALEAKMHVIVEKPMALTLAEADAMLAAARAHRRLLMVEQSLRFHPVHEAARALLRRRAIGGVTQVRGYLGHAGPEYWAGARRTWFTDRRVAGGGALMDVGSHLVDLVRWLPGKDIRRIFCHATTLEKRIGVEDNAAALVEFDDGAVGSFAVSWTARPYQVMTHFCGSHGQLRTVLGDDPPIVLQRSRRTGDRSRPTDAPVYPTVPAPDQREGAFRSFIESIATHRAPSVPAEEGRRNLAVVLAAYESMRTRAWVTLPIRGGQRR
jgi:predicted dehydrogenase